MNFINLGRSFLCPCRSCKRWSSEIRPWLFELDDRLYIIRRHCRSLYQHRPKGLRQPYVLRLWRVCQRRLKELASHMSLSIAPRPAVFRDLLLVAPLMLLHLSGIIYSFFSIRRIGAFSRFGVYRIWCGFVPIEGIPSSLTGIPFFPRLPFYLSIPTLFLWS